MHIHQQNHWNRVLFHWYQSYHWYQWRPFLSPLTPMESICEYWTTLKINGLHYCLTRLAFFLRNWTKVFLSSLCEIWIPLTLFSCSDSAQNKQFPDAWLSETKNPFFAATVLRLDGRMVLLRTWSASHRKFRKDGRMFSAGKKRQLFLHFQQFDRCAQKQILFIIFMGHDRLSQSPLLLHSGS